MERFLAETPQEGIPSFRSDALLSALENASFQTSSNTHEPARSSSAISDKANSADSFLNDVNLNHETRIDTKPISLPFNTLPADLNDDSILLEPLAHVYKLERVESRIAENSLVGEIFECSEGSMEASLRLGKKSSLEPSISFPPEAWGELRSMDSHFVTLIDNARLIYHSRHNRSASFLDLLTSYASFEHEWNRKGEHGAPYIIGRIEDQNVSGRDLPIVSVLLDSRNLLVRVCQNISWLQENSLCDGFISLIYIDDTRTNVAKLVTVSYSQILKLTQWVDRILKATFWGILQGIEILGTTCMPSTFMFKEHLGEIYDFLSNNLEGIQDVLVGVISMISHVLNLTVLLYCGAHLEPVDELYLNRSIEKFEITGRDKKMVDRNVTISRHRLGCLDDFLKGHPVWIFSFDNEVRPSESSTLMASIRLHLSTSIIGFADLWGPVWEMKRQNGDGGNLHHYDAGSGSIINWSQSGNPSSRALETEISCHWSSNKSEVENAAPILLRERLLIGGESHISLSSRDRCNLKHYDIQRMLQVADCLKYTGTQKPQKTLDSETIQVGGSHFVQMGYGRTYKQRSGKPLKDRIVELWTHEPACRNPRTLQIWGGLEISICTINARRRKLVHILGSSTMLSFLQDQFFKWPDNCYKG